jgi:CRISPR-associated endonuclease Csy4
MRYYQEIELKPQEGINVYFLWQKVYQQLHLAMVEIKNQGNTSPVGVSFPEYDEMKNILGTKIRLFADNEELLRELDAEKWLSRLRDYTHVKPIEHVPEQTNGYACFRHVKMKGNSEKLARRRAKRKGESLEQALSCYDDYKERESKLPYINFTSQSNGNHFRLFIEKKIMEQPKAGFFSCYGLSNETTVPLF